METTEQEDQRVIDEILERYLPAGKAAEVLNVTIKTIGVYLNDGPDNRLRGVKVGGRWHVSKVSLQTYLEKRKPQYRQNELDE